MYPKVATAYDQNPARIRLVVDVNRKRSRKAVSHLPIANVYTVLAVLMVCAMM